MSQKESEKTKEPGLNPQVAELLKSLGLSTKEEALAKAINELTKTDHIELLSNLYPFEDDELALIKLIGKRYHADFLTEYVDVKLELRCSVGGWRAGQVTNIASEVRKNQGGNFLSRLLHRGSKDTKTENDLS